MKSILKATESITGKQGASLYVSTIGLEEQQKPIVRPHGLPVYQIFYCTAGSGELVVNEERYCIEAGNGFFLKANEMHSYYKIGSEWRLSYLGFQGTLCEPLLETYGLTKSGAFKVSADQRFMKEFRQLYEYLETFGEQDSAEVSKLCYGCLLEILETMNWIDVGKNAESDEVIERIMEYLHSLKKFFNINIKLRKRTRKHQEETVKEYKIGRNRNTYSLDVKEDKNGRVKHRRQHVKAMVRKYNLKGVTEEFINDVIGLYKNHIKNYTEARIDRAMEWAIRTHSKENNITASAARINQLLKQRIEMYGIA